MSSGPRHHGPKFWTQDRGDAVRWAARTITQVFGAGYRRPEMRDASRQWPPGWRRARRGEPRWFTRAPPRRPFWGSREPGYWRLRSFSQERGSNWQPPPVQRPGDRRFAPTPRRGPPVAAIKVPRWHRQELSNERWPRGSDPRGPLRGGPERSASDPQRTPRDGLCGGPERSSDDTRLSKTTQAKAKRETKRKKGAKWPIVVTVEKSGEGRSWGPLSRTAPWKASCYWEEKKGEAKVFLEKCGEKKEVSVEKLIGEDGPRFWFKDQKPDPPKQQPEKRTGRPVCYGGGGRRFHHRRGGPGMVSQMKIKQHFSDVAALSLVEMGDT